MARIDQLTTVRGTTLAWTTAMAVCVPLVATVAANPVVDVVLVGVAGVLGLGGVGLGWARHRVLQQPLRLSSVACRGMLGGVRVYRFRACLGRGRPFSSGVAQVGYEHAGGRTTLPVTLPQLVCGVGPWTLVVTDPDGVVDVGGVFVVHVQVQEGARSWSVAQRYAVDDLQAGAFGSDVAMSPSGLRVNPDAWDVVQQEAWS